MLEAAKNILLILSALFPIVNPLGGSPIFLALTHDYPRTARRALARKVAVNSFILLIASFMVGTHILHFFGISIPVAQPLAMTPGRRQPGPPESKYRRSAGYACRP